MIQHRASGVEEENKATEAGSNKSGDDNRPPVKANSVKRGSDVIGRRREGDGELEGEEVPWRPLPLNRGGWFQVDVGPFSVRLCRLSFLLMSLLDAYCILERDHG